MTEAAEPITITDTAAASVAPVSVLVAAVVAPGLPAGLKDPARVRAVADPNRALRAAVPGLGDTRGPAVVLVNRSGAVSRTLPRVASVDEFRADLAALALQ